MHQGKFSMEIRNNLFNQMIFKYWSKLPRERVESMLLEVFQRSVDVILRDV